MTSAGCCGLDTPHDHMCYLGPAGWLAYHLWWWLTRKIEPRRRSTAGEAQWGSTDQVHRFGLGKDQTCQ